MMADCLADVVTAANVPKSDILSDRRDSKVAKYRQLAMWLCRHRTHQSLPAIGRFFNRDHTTVIHAIEATDRRIRRDHEFAEFANRLRPDIVKFVTPNARAVIMQRFEDVQ